MSETSGDFFETLLAAPDATIHAALGQMDAAGEKILIVTAPDRTLLGVVTDGDIRRWILAGKGLDQPVSAVMTADPVTLPADFVPEEARELMVARRVECVPVLDAERRVIAALRWVDLFEVPRRTYPAIDAPVVIMAGGEGTRLAPLTRILPKPLVPLGDTPVVELIIDRFVRHGCSEFYLTVNYKAELIKAYFAEVPHTYRLHYAREDKPLGTAGSLSLLREELGDRTFFLSNCDILIDADYADVMRYHREHGDVITIVASMKRFQIPYGVCEIAEGGSLVRIDEKPSFDHLVSTGLYVVEPEVLADIPDGRRLDFTDVVNRYLAEGKRIGVYPVSEDSWVDMGQWEQFQDALGRFGMAQGDVR